MGIEKWHYSALPTLALALVLVLSPAISLAQSLSAVQQLGESFVHVAQKITPTVVNVSSIRKAAQVSKGNDMERFFEQSPFREFFGDEFFKRFKGLPNEDGGAERKAMGSGVIVSPDGTILTNAHVVKGMHDITVTLADKRSFKARVLGMDPESDIAVIIVIL